MRNRNYWILGVLIAGLTASCARNPKSPGREFIPDMGRYVAYEGYFENPGEPILPQGMNAQKSPSGSISQTDDVYPYPGTIDGYNAAGESYTNPFQFAEAEITGEGKRLFGIYCAVCHGDKGDGQGHLVQINKFPPPPSYFTDALLAVPEGKRYHTLMYGKGLMGSYATQINHRERWLVLEYVQSLQDAYLAANAPAEGETAAAN